MKKGQVLLLSVMLSLAGNANAQDSGELIDLLPEGVTANINPERKWDKQKNLVVAGSPEKGYKAFFAATDSEHGEELWVTDGTPEGTYCVMDINWERYGEGQPGYEEGYTRNSGLDNLENYNNERVFFQAWTPDYGSEPWTSDGLAAEGLNGPGESGTEHTYMI